jgi:hypothetical protein
MGVDGEQGGQPGLLFVGEQIGTTESVILPS